MISVKEREEHEMTKTEGTFHATVVNHTLVTLHYTPMLKPSTMVRSNLQNLHLVNNKTKVQNQRSKKILNQFKRFRIVIIFNN